MKTRATYIGMGLAFALMGAAVHAEQHAGFREGDMTLTLSGGGTSDRKFKTSAESLQVGLGWFVTDHIALGLRQDVSHVRSRSDNDWNGSTRLGADFFLSLGPVVPYVGVNIGYIYGDGVKDQFIAGPNAGLRVFVNDTTFINLGVEYQFLFDNRKEAEDTYKDGRFVHSLGLGVKW